MMKPIISVSHVSKMYHAYEQKSSIKTAFDRLFLRKKESIKAISNLSFTINEGEIVGILGPNGSGKSTLLKLLSGSLSPSSGLIDVSGSNPCKLQSRHEQHMISYALGKQPRLSLDIPPIDSFKKIKTLYRINDIEFKERIDFLTGSLEIKDAIAKPVRQLSLGECVKCELAMTMLPAPLIVILDEPYIGLDVCTKETIRSFILQMNRKGTTFLFTSHNLEDAEQLANHIILLNHGEKLFDDSLQNLTEYLGNKKRIELVLTSPYHPLNIEGLSLVSQKSDSEIILEADLSLVTIDDLLKNLSETNSYTDISIRPLPLETILNDIKN